MEAVIAPQPPDDDRRALLEALAAAEPDSYDSEWRRAALREGTEADEP